MKRILFVLVAGLLAHGCAAGAGAAFVATGAGVAAAAGVQHSLGGIAYKTFSVSTNELRFATLQTLYRMDLKVVQDVEKGSGRTIVAKATERTIEIELEALTRRVTRMRVVADMDELFFRDAATATEIIVQTAQTLDTQVSERH